MAEQATGSVVGPEAVEYSTLLRVATKSAANEVDCVEVRGSQLRLHPGRPPYPNYSRRYCRRFTIWLHIPNKARTLIKYRT